MDEFVVKDVSCKLCAESFKSLMVKKSKIKVSKTDSDYCIHYEGEVPFFYSVLICPQCGYTFLESFKKPDISIKDKVKSLPDVFSGKRNAATAQILFKRAIDCALLQKENETVLASLYLQLAWVFRMAGNEEHEEDALKKALDYYVEVYEKADLTDASKVMYLIGELKRRVDQKRDAVYWFSRVTNDPRSSQATRRMAREAWQSLKGPG